MNPKKRNTIIGAIALLIIAVIAYIGLGHKSTEASAVDTKVVKVGIMSGNKQEQEIWKTVSKTAKDDYGLTLKFVYFTDYSQPNEALISGDVDVNAFQSYNYAKNWNNAHKDTEIASVGDTFITPMHVYSKKITDLSELTDGDTVTIPNDTVNETRALFVLQSAGVLKLNTTDNSKLVGVNDIVSNPKNLKIKEVDASQTARALDSVTISVVNYNYATAAGLPKSESIYLEPITKDSKQYINFIATISKEKDNKIYKQVAKAYANEATAKAMEVQYPDGGERPAWDLKF
ncbi:MAG: MetQ/NlpA family ABC transporter substrate-binding protein [Lactococcus sp.]